MIAREDIKEIKMEDCSVCIHYDICKYISNMKSLKNTIASTLNIQDNTKTEEDDSSSNAPFLIELTCLKKKSETITFGQFSYRDDNMDRILSDITTTKLNGNPPNATSSSGDWLRPSSFASPVIPVISPGTFASGTASTASNKDTKENSTKKLAPPPAMIPLDPRVIAPADIDDGSPNDIQTKNLTVK